MSVLVVTHSRDHAGVVRVIDAIRARGHDAIRLDTDRFPTEARLSVEQSNAGERARLEVDGITHDLSSVEAIWYRRMRPATLPDGMDPDHKGVAAGEARQVLLGLINGLPAFRLDPWAAVKHADHKQRQLHLARAVGLDLPPTLTTNDPAAARAFVARHPAGVVCKMLSSFALGPDEQVVFTNAVGADDLEALDGLSLCPMVFQARIERVVELRCTVVGYEVHCAALDAEASRGAADDWRRDGAGLAGAWRPYTLPGDIAVRLLALASRLGLNYGAADLLVDAEGTHHFLEMNPAGEYGWVERAAELPIGHSIARVLCDPSARRVKGMRS